MKQLLFLLFTSVITLSGCSKSEQAEVKETLSEKTSSVISDTNENIKTGAENLKEAAAEKIADAKEVVAEKTEKAKKTVAETTEKVKEASVEQIEQAKEKGANAIEELKSKY
jgi:membrane-bound lytic murein transglycosylase